MNCAEVSEAIKAAMPFADEKSKMICFQPFYNNLVFKSVNSDKQFETKTRCDFPQNGAPAVGVNSEYFLDAMQTAGKGAEIVSFEYKNGLAQFAVRGETSRVKFEFVIMPLRFGKGEHGNIAPDGTTIDYETFSIITDEEKEELKGAPAFVSTAQRKSEPEKQATPGEDFYPFAETALVNCLNDLAWLRGQVELVPESIQASFRERLERMRTAIDACQYA